jgi:hypothetical protein
MKHQIIINSSGKVTTYKAEYKNSILAKLIVSSAGRSALAQAMAAPIRRNLDYQGIARRTLVVEPLPTSALPVYDKNKTFGTQVTVPTFEIINNPTISLADIKMRRFNIIDRYKNLYRRKIYIR